ncbi:MAG: alpha/beta fold hydrolase [Tsuneonella sp.]
MSWTGCDHRKAADTLRGTARKSPPDGALSACSSMYCKHYQASLETALGALSDHREWEHAFMTFRYGACLAVYVVSTASVAVAQDTSASLAARFGALEAVKQASLSPDGAKIAYVAEAVEGSRVYVARPDTPGVPKLVMRVAREVGSIGGCAWAANERIVCRARATTSVGGILVSGSRLYAVNEDGTGLFQLTREGGVNAYGIQQDGGSVIDYDVADEPGTILMTREFLPDDRVGSLIGSSKGGLGVERVDTATGKRSTVEPPKTGTFEYISDGHGNVRLMGTMSSDLNGYERGKRRYFYRKPGARSWDELSMVDENGYGFEPYAVDAEKNVAYGFDDDGGFQALYSVSLDGAATKTKILSRKGVDVDELVTIGRQSRVIGAGYATERRQVEYFDPQLKALSKSLGAALPGNPVVDIVGASQDERRLLIVASGDTQPGMYYVFDKPNRKLIEVLPARPLLEGVKLAPMEPISFPAADGTMIPGYLTLPIGGTGKNLPAIVMPHGGPSARDEWGFDWLVQYFAARGFAVVQPNYRGSSGYGSAYFQRNGFQSWRTAIGDVNDAGRWLVNEGIAAPDKLAIFGWSYGGYAALQSSVLDPSLFKAIVAVAPVTDLARLKSDAANYTNGSVVARFVGNGPHVSEGSPAQNASRITAPVLMFSGDKDLNVDIGHARSMESRLKSAGKTVNLVEFPGLDHHIAEAEARAKLLADSEDFLRQALGIQAN